MIYPIIDSFFTKSGQFNIDGVDLPALLSGRKTPFYVYSASVIRHKYEILKSHFPFFDIFYSFKPNPNIDIARILLNKGANAEISSMGELHAALKAGFDPSNIIFVNPAKTEEELEFAIKSGIYAIVSDSRYELELIDKIASRFGKQVRVMLRINTLEGPRAAPEIMIGGPSKFGFDEETIDAELHGNKFSSLNIAGIQVYAASQVMDADAIIRHIENVLNVAVRIKKQLRTNIECIDFGGGFGVPYSGEQALNVEYISAKAELLTEFAKNELPGCRYILEIGRYLVAECGVFVTRVLRRKESRGMCFIVTDGGMNHFTRPAFMQVRHPVRILNRIESHATQQCIVCGPCCAPIDIIGDNVMLPEPEIDDIIGVFNAGAYGYTMSMLNFISFGWPEEVLVDSGSIRTIRKRLEPQDYVDLTACE